MHIKLKIDNTELKEKYENHTFYHEGDAGLDLFSPEDIIIPAKQKGKVDLQVSCEAVNNDNKNISFYMYPRSSVGTKTPLILANSVGIIDRGYRGHLGAVFYNTSDVDYIVKKGDRLVQICAPNLEEITFELAETLSETDRGSQGFGSTGK